jgi:LL-diaminopimelate aminotransferase
MNPYIAQLPNSYLFAEIERRIAGREVINLGIGDAKGPLVPHVAKRLEEAARSLGTPEGFHGYGPSEGLLELREAIAETLCDGLVSPDEVFVSDGAKPDLARLQLLFVPGSRAAIIEPAYPVYVEATLLAGHKPILLPELPDTFPDADLLYICSPNNPTGKVISIDHLDGPIIFDSAYKAFGGDNPFRTAGARERVIETGSFSKLAGFTGVRLGYTVVCKEHPLHNSWRRLQSTLFNGASILSQMGGLAALEPEGWTQIQSQVTTVRENASLLAEALDAPKTAPYVWKRFGQSSWDLFDHFLDEYGIVTTPGVGFGPSGEGYLRFSGFASREEVERALDRLGAAASAPLATQ